ncbi:hypothetical protein M3Y98_00850800 [Aphelenchoides besseyi]|nr:hypothetical protein M3Y98_00850800 [Aphelenchoides besseyi]
MKRQLPDYTANKFGMMGGDQPSNVGAVKRHRNTTDGYVEALEQGKYELRLLIPSKASGAIIGRQGSQIQSIREKYNANMQIPDRHTFERVCTIVVQQERLIECFREILSRLGEELEKYNNKKASGEVEIRMLVHQSHAGAIIGRQGSKIKELREQTGAVLKVFQECCPLSTDRVLLISSQQDKLPDVLGVLIEFIREVPIKGVIKNYDAVNYDARLAYVYGGYLMDKQNEMSGGRSYGGQRGGGYMAAPNHYGDYERSHSYPPNGAYGQMNPYARGNQIQMGPPYGMHDNQAINATQVTIPNELCGTIIGKGGERINQIRSDSGAKIDVSQPYGSNERIITITGTGQQIHSAQYFLQQTVRSSEAGRRYLASQNVR